MPIRTHNGLGSGNSFATAGNVKKIGMPQHLFEELERILSLKDLRDGELEIGVKADDMLGFLSAQGAFLDLKDLLVQILQ